MEEINKVIKNKKQKFIANKASKLNSSLTSILKLSLASALFFIAAFMISAAGIIVEDGALNVSNNLLIDTNTLFVDSINNKAGIGTANPATVLDVKGKANFTGNFSAGQTSNIFFVDNTSGRVGIGTISPTTMLHIYRNDVTRPILRVEQAGGSSGGLLSLMSNTAEWQMYTQGDDLRFANPATVRAVFLSNGNVGIGTTSPGEKLDIAHDTDADITITSGGTSDNPAFYARRARGTIASPTIVADGDTLGELRGYGYDGAAYQAAAIVRFQVDGTPGANDMPSRIFFMTTPDQSETALERMRITSAGNVGIGTTSPTHKLHVVGSQNLTGTLYYGALQAQSPHAFINNDAKSRTEICLVADDGIVVLQYLKNIDGNYQWVFESNAAECLNKEITTDIIIEYEEIYNETLGMNVTVEKSRTEVKKKVFQ